MRGKSNRGNSAHFLALRKRLDLMGYVDLPLGLDTAPLAQQLLEDLVTTTEALRENEEELTKTKDKLEISETQIEPLQSENTRLTRENVQLHQQLIMASEETQRLENQHSAAAFELQNDNRRLKLLNQKASEHVKEIQKKCDQMQERLQQAIAAPSMMKVPEIIESDPRKMKTKSRTASTSRGTSVVSSESSFSVPNISFDPNLFNTELDNLRKERDQARKDAEAAIVRMNELENVVKIRDDEIHRLGSELQRETGRDGFLVSLRHKFYQQQEEIEKLRAQVRVVNPNSTVRKPRRLILTPARTMVSIQDSVLLETSKTPSIISSVRDLDTTDFTDTDQEDFPTPRVPIQPEPHPDEIIAQNSSKQDIQQPQETQQPPKKSGFAQLSESESNSDDENEDNDLSAQRSAPQVQFKEDPTATVSIRHHGSKQSKSRVKVQIPQMQQQQQQILALQQQLANQEELISQKEKLQAKIERNEKKNQKVLQIKEKEISTLRAKIETLSIQLSEKDKAISSMAADFAYINDNIAQVMAEKDQLISEFKNKASEPIEIISDNNNAEVNSLRFEIEEMKIENEKQVEAKNKQIDQLQALVQTLSSVQSVPGSEECQECIKLRKRIEDLENAKQQAAQAEANADPDNNVQNLKTRIKQLEVLIRTSQEETKESAQLDEQLQIAKNQLTERDAQMEKIRAAAAKQQNEMRELQKKVEESEEKMKNLPDVEARYRTIIEQLKSEHVAINNEIKQKRGEIKTLTERLQEAQRLMRERQIQLQNAREEAANAREEAAFHRAKSEEITKKAQEQSSNVVKEANAAVHHLKGQLQTKMKESDLYQKLLAEARQQIAPLKEQVIPKLKSQILKLQQERDEILKKVKRISQLAIYVDANMTQSPDATAFSAAVHQLQDELRPYAQL